MKVIPCSFLNNFLINSMESPQFTQIVRQDAIELNKHLFNVFFTKSEKKDSEKNTNLLIEKSLNHKYSKMLLKTDASGIDSIQENIIFHINEYERIKIKMAYYVIGLYKILLNSNNNNFSYMDNISKLLEDSISKNLDLTNTGDNKQIVETLNDLITNLLSDETFNSNSENKILYKIYAFIYFIHESFKLENLLKDSYSLDSRNSFINFFICFFSIFINQAKKKIKKDHRQSVLDELNLYIYHLYYCKNKHNYYDPYIEIEINKLDKKNRQDEKIYNSYKSYFSDGGIVPSQDNNAKFVNSFIATYNIGVLKNINFEDFKELYISNDQLKKFLELSELFKEVNKNYESFYEASLNFNTKVKNKDDDRDQYKITKETTKSHIQFYLTKISNLITHNGLNNLSDSTNNRVNKYIDGTLINKYMQEIVNIVQDIIRPVESQNNNEAFRANMSKLLYKWIPMQFYLFEDSFAFNFLKNLIDSNMDKNKPPKKKGYTPNIELNNFLKKFYRVQDFIYRDFINYKFNISKTNSTASRKDFQNLFFDYIQEKKPGVLNYYQFNLNYLFHNVEHANLLFKFLNFINEIASTKEDALLSEQKKLITDILYMSSKLKTSKDQPYKNYNFKNKKSNFDNIDFQFLDETCSIDINKIFQLMSEERTTPMLDNILNIIQKFTLIFLNKLQEKEFKEPVNHIFLPIFIHKNQESGILPTNLNKQGDISKYLIKKDIIQTDSKKPIIGNDINIVNLFKTDNFFQFKEVQDNKNLKDSNVGFSEFLYMCLIFFNSFSQNNAPDIQDELKKIIEENYNRVFAKPKKEKKTYFYFILHLLFKLLEFKNSRYAIILLLSNLNISNSLKKFNKDNRFLINTKDKTLPLITAIEKEKIILKDRVEKIKSYIDLIISYLEKSNRPFTSNSKKKQESKTQELQESQDSMTLSKSSEISIDESNISVFFPSADNTFKEYEEKCNFIKSQITINDFSFFEKWHNKLIELKTHITQQELRILYSSRSIKSININNEQFQFQIHNLMNIFINNLKTYNMCKQYNMSNTFILKKDGSKDGSKHQIKDIESLFSPQNNENHDININNEIIGKTTKDEVAISSENFLAVIYFGPNNAISFLKEENSVCAFTIKKFKTKTANGSLLLKTHNTFEAQGFRLKIKIKGNLIPIINQLSVGDRIYIRQNKDIACSQCLYANVSFSGQNCIFENIPFFILSKNKEASNNDRDIKIINKRFFDNAANVAPYITNKVEDLNYKDLNTKIDKLEHNLLLNKLAMFAHEHK